jgi:hypothetical protein
MPLSSLYFLDVYGSSIVYFQVFLDGANMNAQV